MADNRRSQRNKTSKAINCRTKYGISQRKEKIVLLVHELKCEIDLLATDY